MTILELFVDGKLTDIAKVESGKGSKKQMDEWTLRYRDENIYFKAAPLIGKLSKPQEGSLQSKIFRIRRKNISVL